MLEVVVAPTSHAGRDWNQLKQRAVGETRTVPCPPELTALLHRHITEFGTGADGRIFRGERNDKEMPKRTPIQPWRQARVKVFSGAVAASPLARTPYDLRHAAVSTWLNAGVPPATVAAWTGHSIEVLLRIYAKRIDGEGAVLRQRVDDALGPVKEEATDAQDSGDPPAGGDERPEVA